ncbi:MAG: hypothetical protein ACLP5E_08075 [Streptosporangiaceae bacterium]
MPILGIVIGQTFERLLAVARGGTGEADGAFAYSHPAAVALGEHRLLRWRHPEPFPLTTRRLRSPRRVPCGGPGPSPPGTRSATLAGCGGVLVSGGNRPRWCSPR